MNSTLTTFTRLLVGMLIAHVGCLSAQSPDLPYSSGSTGADGALNLTTPPAPRFDHAMTYDDARQRVLLFGGSAGGNETWEWDGINWTQKMPAISPGVHGAHALAYDTSRQRVVLFGGNAENDTWEWDGINWAQKMPATSPSGRSDHAMAYDSARQRVVLFGGGASNLNDTWEWDGTNWTQKTPATSPPGRREHALAYDSVRQRVVLFGGRISGYLNDTWEWDGTNWTQKAPTISPGVRYAHALAYDTARQRVVVFGGFNNSFLNDTWEWDGTNWTQKAPVTSPANRALPALAYDTARQKVVLFGGLSGGTQFNDSWVWDGTDWIGGGGTHFLDMTSKANGIWNYTSITIGSGVKLTFTKNAANTPLTWLASGEVKIDGEVNLDGTSPPDSTPLPGTQGKGGPGGFDGGLGGIRFNASGSYAGTPGQGPGGGSPGVTLGQFAQPANSNYINSYLQPLLGGSGGGGGASSNTSDSRNGGGGGGAILISSSRDITLNGTLHANGAAGGNGGAAGSGGAIRLVADRVIGTGSISTAGIFSSTAGKIQIEGFTRSLLQTGSTSTTPLISAPVPTAPTNNQPALAITNVAGLPVAQPPTGNPSAPDVIFSEAGSISITVTASNVPDGTPVTCRVVSGSQIINLPASGTVTLAGGTCSFSTTVQAGLGSVQAFCNFTAAP